MLALFALWLSPTTLSTAAAQDSADDQPAPAPEFALPDLDGNRHALEDYRGKIVLLDFWSRSCRSCLRLMDQSYKPLHEEYGDDERFALIGISTDNPADQRTLAQQHGYEWLKLHDERGEAFRQYGVRFIPYAVLIDEHGNKVLSGAGTQLDDAIREYLQTRLAEDDLAATANVTPDAPAGASEGGFNSLQVIVLIAVIIFVIFLTVRDKKKQPDTAAVQRRPPFNGGAHAPGLGEPSAPGGGDSGVGPAAPPNGGASPAQGEQQPRTNFMGGDLGNSDNK